MVRTKGKEGIEQVFIKGDEKYRLFSSMISNRKIPNSKEDEMLMEAAKSASARAIRISKALRLPIHYIRDGELIEELPDGTRKVIKTIVPVKSKFKWKGRTAICLKRKD